MNTKTYDSYVKKSRALIIDKEKNILICEINESLSLPGGSIENNETPREAIIREIEEEVGITLENFEEVVTLKHYHEDFPYLKVGGRGNRISEVHYFYKEIEEYIPGNSHLTDYETREHLKIIKIKLNDLLRKLDEPSSNFYKKYMSEETKEILDYMLKNNYKLK